MLLYNSPLAGYSAIDERLDKNKRTGMTLARMEQLVSSQPYNVSKYAIYTPYNQTL